MLWQGKELRTIGETVDAAIRVAIEQPELAPLFLAQYVSVIDDDIDNKVLTAISNLNYIAGHYSKESTEIIRNTYGSPYTAEEATRGP